MPLPYQAPPYVYQAYPKMVAAPDGRRVRVENEDHHLDLEAQWEAQNTPSRDALLAQATELGLKVDGRWSDKRLAEEIEAAK